MWLPRDLVSRPHPRRTQAEGCGLETSDQGREVYVYVTNHLVLVTVKQPQAIAHNTYSTPFNL